MKSTISFLKKHTDKETGISSYYLNEPAYRNTLSEFHLYTRLMNDTEQTVIETYTYPLLCGTPKILNYTDDVRNFNME
jgi:hypothetical protein